MRTSVFQEISSFVDWRIFYTLIPFQYRPSIRFSKVLNPLKLTGYPCPPSNTYNALSYCLTVESTDLATYTHKPMMLANEGYSKALINLLVYSKTCRLLIDKYSLFEHVFSVGNFGVLKTKNKHEIQHFHVILSLFPSNFLWLINTLTI